MLYLSLVIMMEELIRIQKLICRPEMHIALNSRILIHQTNLNFIVDLKRGLHTSIQNLPMSMLFSVTKMEIILSNLKERDPYQFFQQHLKYSATNMK